MRASSSCVTHTPQTHLHSPLFFAICFLHRLCRSADDEKQLLMLLLTNALALIQLRLSLTLLPSLRPTTPRADAAVSAPPHDCAAPPSVRTGPPAPSVHTPSRPYLLVNARAVATIRLLDLLQHVETVQETLVLVHQLRDLDVFLPSRRRERRTSRSASAALVDRCASFCWVSVSSDSSM